MHASRHKLVTGALVVAAVAGTWAVAGSQSASALPPGQGTCEFDNRLVTSAMGWQPLTATRTAVSATTSYAKLEVDVDLAVSPGAVAQLGWSINGAAPLADVYGPANLAYGQVDREGRQLFGLVRRPTGAFSARPFVRVLGPAGSAAQFDSRCFTIEANTN